MLPRDIYRQPAAADPVLDETVVLAIGRRHGVRSSTVLRVDETGGEARAYLLEGHVVVKVQRPHRLRPRTSLAKETFFLQQLAAYVDIVAPRVLGHGRYDQVEYIVMTQMPGVPALAVELVGEKRRELLWALGRMLRRLHAISQAPFYGSALFPGKRTREAFVERMRLNMAHAVAVLETAPNVWPLDLTPAELVVKVLAALPASIDLVALHSNPGPVHTFVQPDTLRLSGLIDFGDAYIGHPALDWRWPSHEDCLTILQGYGDEAPLSAAFMDAWRAVRVLHDLELLATRPATRPQTLERLRTMGLTFV